MVAVAVAPLVLKDTLLTIGANDFQKHVDQVIFTPSASQISWTGLGGNTHTDVSTATWALTLKYAQDWETANSLSQYLFANEGLSVAMTFKPKAAGAKSFTATVLITPGAIGGDVNAYATATVTLGVTGKPVLVP